MRAFTTPHLCQIVLAWLILTVSSVHAAFVEIDNTGMSKQASDTLHLEKNENDPEKTERFPVKSNTPLTTAEHGMRQIDWVRAEGGFVHAAFEIRRVDPEDPTSRYGVFANQPLSKGEILLEIPRHCLISGGWHETCTTVEILAHEMAHHEESHWEPYISYLRTQLEGQLPAFYSPQGQALLHTVLGENGALPPGGVTASHIDCFNLQEASPEEFYAEMLVVQRSWDHLLIPVWDMVSHRNNGLFHSWVNVEEKYSVHDESRPITIHTTRDIAAGEELYMTYTHCPDCSMRATTYGTPEVMRDYGFVEFPQKWIFLNQGVAFGVDTRPDGNDTELALEWYSQRPNDDTLDFWQEQIDRLKSLQAADLAKNTQQIPEHEWNVITGYTEAYLVALELAVREATTPDTTTSDRRMKLLRDMMDWIASFDGASIHDGFEIRLLDSTNPKHSPFGLFATRDIAEEELLISIPEDSAIKDEKEREQYDSSQVPCGTARNILNEWKAGNESAYAPYVAWLQETSQGYGKLPTEYSPDGKELLKRIAGYYGESNRLTPEEPDWIYREWIHECRGGRDDQLGLHAAALAVQRHWDGRLFPLFELISHSRSTHRVNTISHNDSGEGVKVFASRAIVTGEQIMTNHDETDLLEGNWGTGQVFADIGIVEQFPQKWVLPTLGAKFLVDRFNEEGEEKLSFQWIGEPIDGRRMIVLEHEYDRLMEEVWEDEFKFRNEKIPEAEYMALVEYYNAITTALRQLLLLGNDGDLCLSMSYIDSKICLGADRRYDELDTPYGEYDFKDETCDRKETLNLRNFHIVDQVQSPYQSITYMQDKYTKNMCFDLDLTYQICTSYRPHYHETMVHYFARFLPKVSRVLFVGGGDSMLLHEVLKYPSLELVVGLELDQTVTRYAFKYFGTQPHFDDPRVEWWFGDASKSLLMLPEEYFGSFDLVLVDLSETLMSNTVTQELDILSALSLLLRPEGIFVKNEMYLNQMSEIFDHSLLVHIYDVPLVCSQPYSVGSKGTNFVNATHLDHNVETLFSPVHEIDDDLLLAHDYIQNPDAKTPCLHSTDQTDNETKNDEGESRPGIVLIIEAENVHVNLEDSTSLESIFVSRLQENGFTVLATEKSDIESKKGAVLVIFDQGYLSARIWPKTEYIALDIHLWGSFHMMKGLEKSLLISLGGGAKASASTYRIVATGMYGTSTFFEDSRRRGPHVHDDCISNTKSEPTREEWTEAGDSLVQIAVRESLNVLVQAMDYTAVVVCGSAETCLGTDVLSDIEYVWEVLPIYTCDSLNEISDGEEPTSEHMFKCELEVLESLESPEEMIDVLIFDQSASYPMAQILNKILSSVKLKSIHFSDELVVLAPMLNPFEAWRQIFVNNFNLFYRQEPAFWGSMHLNEAETHKTLVLNVFSAGDFFFVTHLKEAISSISTQAHDTTGEIRDIGGTHFSMQEGFKYDHFFLPSDFDQEEPLYQWQTQQPLGLQNIVQFKVTRDLTSVSFQELVHGALLTMHLEAALRVVDEGVGDGCIMTALWPMGNAVFLWDGQDNVCLNLFLFEEDEKLSEQFYNAFGSSSIDEEPILQVSVRDMQPRGNGRVVNFAKDLRSRAHPYFTHVSSKEE